MQKTTITLTIDEERGRAMEIFLKKENTTVQKKMDEALTQLYERTVPEAVREYLDAAAAPKRPSRPSQTKAKSKATKEEHDHEQP